MSTGKEEKTKEELDKELDAIMQDLKKDQDAKIVEPEKATVNAQFLKAAQDAELEKQKLAAIQAQQTQQPIAVHQVIDPNKNTEEAREELVPIVSAFLEYCKKYPKPENNENKDAVPRLEGNAMHFPKESDAEDFFKGQAKANIEFTVKSNGRVPEIYMHGDGKGGFFKGNREEFDTYLKNKKDNASSFTPTQK